MVAMDKLSRGLNSLFIALNSLLSVFIKLLTGLNSLLISIINLFIIPDSLFKGVNRLMRGLIRLRGVVIWLLLNDFELCNKEQRCFYSGVAEGLLRKGWGDSELN